MCACGAAEREASAARQTPASAVAARERSGAAGGAVLTFAKLLPQNAMASSLVTDPSLLVSILSKKVWLGSYIIPLCLRSPTDHPCVHADRVWSA